MPPGQQHEIHKEGMVHVGAMRSSMAHGPTCRARPSCLMPRRRRAGSGASRADSAYGMDAGSSSNPAVNLGLSRAPPHGRFTINH
jgi:hypothetical protein